jgi:hypothetical protein
MVRSDGEGMKGLVGSALAFAVGPLLAEIHRTPM